MEKKGTPASPATARANRVLPVPGGPTSRTPDEQDALWHTRPEPAVALRLLQECHDLLEFRLGLVHAGDVLEGDLGVGLDIDLGLALADRHKAAAKPLLLGDAPDDEHPESEEQDHRKQPRQQVTQEGVFRGSREWDAILFEPLGEGRIDPVRHDVLGLGALFALQCPANGLRGENDFADLVVFQILLELTVRDGLDVLCLRPEVLKHEDPEHGQHDIPDVDFHSPIHFAPPGKLGLGSGSRPMVVSIHMD